MTNSPTNRDFSHARPLPLIQRNPHFEAIGGEASIARLVDRFYYYMDTLPEAAAIRAMHEPDLSHTRQVLVKFLVEWLGGPKVYSVERDAWMLCMRRAMDDVIDNAMLKGELEQAFFKTADFIRNDKRSTHA